MKPVHAIEENVNQVLDALRHEPSSEDDWMEIRRLLHRAYTISVEQLELIRNREKAEND